MAHDGMGVPVKRDTRELSPSPCAHPEGRPMKAERRQPSASRREPPPGSESARTLALNFPDSKTTRNTFQLSKPPSPWYFVVQPTQNKTKTPFQRVFFYKSLQILRGLSFPMCQSNVLGQRELCDYFQL